MKQPISISIYTGTASYQVTVMADPDMVDISQELLNFGQALENGGGIYEARPTPRAAVPYAVARSPAPDWTCGCGTTLHGDEGACWRCGAKKKP